MNPNGFVSMSPMQIVHSLLKNRQLIWQMTKRDVIGRYKGSALGLTWSFFYPLIMLAVYTFVFSVAFKARWQVGSDSKTEFALALFIGMIVHGLLAECVNRAPSLILSNVNYVKKVVFPLEILPWIAMGGYSFSYAGQFICLGSVFCSGQSDISLDRFVPAPDFCAAHLFYDGADLVFGSGRSLPAGCGTNHQCVYHRFIVYVSGILSDFQYSRASSGLSLCKPSDVYY